ncbi:MAG TPA: PAS domain S-box protein [bacterium]|nr:PAS domain S-box protein [bacterium]
MANPVTGQETGFAQSHLAAVVESTDDAIYSMTLDGVILSWNRAAEEMYGYLAAEAVGASATLLLPPDASDEASEILARLRRGEHITHYETVRQRKDGRRLNVSLTISPIADASRRIVAASAIARDITRRTRAEAALQRMNADLEERVAQRTRELQAMNEELEAFSYTVAHDLRAPLITIAGFAELLLEDGAGGPAGDSQRRLRLIADNTRRMGRLIDDLLAFARLGRRALAEAVVQPAEIARRAWDELDGVRGGRRVELTIADLPPCRADGVLLQQVFVNLLGNALKFTRGQDGPRIEVGWRTDADRPQECVYFVGDNGPGFDPRYAHKLFRIFERLHSADEFEGTGVGLATVHRIVLRHGGRVWAEGDIGNGATVFFTLRRPEPDGSDDG